MVKALGDPTRLRIVDALRKAAPEAICQCELLPLFDDVPARARQAPDGARPRPGVVESERRGLWTYYYVRPDALKELTSWLS